MAIQAVFRRYELKYLLIRRSVEKPAYKEKLRVQSYQQAPGKALCLWS